MMTRTAAADYQADGIHMNSVDTGWVTDEDAAEIAARKVAEHRFHPPLDCCGWGGAGRGFDHRGDEHRRARVGAVSERIIGRRTGKVLPRRSVHDSYVRHQLNPRRRRPEPTSITTTRSTATSP